MSVILEISEDEAVVLFELLSRFSGGEHLTIAHRAEEQVLYNVLAGLETKLVASFQDGYRQVVARARETVPGIDTE